MKIRDIVSTLKFNKHNKIFFRNDNEKKINKNFNILVEFNSFHYYHIYLAYFINIFRKYNSNFFAYPSHVLLSYPIEKTLLQKIKIKILKFLNLGFYGVYQTFGVKNFLDIKINDKIKNETSAKFKIIQKKIKSKKDVLNLKINNIYIGDLLYDTYLKRSRDRVPNLDVKSTKFVKFLNDFISLFLYWEKFIKDKKINKVLVSHATYTIGLPARICINKGGEAYLPEYDRLTRLNKKNYFHFSSSRYYKKDFEKFNRIEKKLFLKEAKKRLNERVSGSIKDIPYMTTSAYSKNSSKNYSKFKELDQIKKIKNKKKILVTTHDFVDASHDNGIFIFSDMVEWIKYLAKQTKKTNLIWLIKNHPDMNDEWKQYQKYTRDVVNRLIKDSNFILIDSNIPHNYLIKKVGIDCVLTVWGQVAHEYAFRKIPVINASDCNIHSAFNFNYHVKNITEYTRLIKNIGKMKHKLNYDEVFKFYYMHYIYVEKNWFFKDIEKFISSIGGYHNLSSKIVYDKWLETINRKDHLTILKNIDNFINSKDLVFTKKNLIK